MNSTHAAIGLGVVATGAAVGLGSYALKTADYGDGGVSLDRFTKRPDGTFDGDEKLSAAALTAGVAGLGAMGGAALMALTGAPFLKPTGAAAALVGGGAAVLAGITGGTVFAQKRYEGSWD